MSYDLVIIGAGIAGLRTGIQTLRSHPHLRCTILEKYKYNGGRVVTYHKDLPQIGHVQWENGAGRIADSHKKVLQLIKHYGLHVAPIPADGNYTTSTSTQPNPFANLHDIYIEPLRSLPKEVLQSKTLVELWNQVLGEKKAREFYSMFPYHSELHTLRADHGIYVFDYEMGRSSGFSVCTEGLSSLIQAMVDEFCSLGGSIQHDQEVIEVSCVDDQMHVKTRGSFYEATTCVLALHADAMRSIKGVSQLSILDKLVMKPLLRMYAVFPVSHGRSWFSDLKKTVTDDPVRHIIPMGKGSIMISYTDGDDAAYWLKQDPKKVPMQILTHIRALFPDRSIPDPLFFKMHPWKEGCTYWKPGHYNIFEESRKSMHPLKEMPGLFVCGESFAVLQCWMECAVEQADHMMELDAFQKRFK